MEETIDKVEEKAKDVKVKVVGNTKDVVEAAKYSVSTSPQTTSPESVAYFHQSEKYTDNKYDKSAQGPDYGKIDSLTEYREKESIITPAPTMGVPEPSYPLQVILLTHLTKPDPISNTVTGKTAVTFSTRFSWASECGKTTPQCG